MATRSMCRELDTNDSSAVTTTILKLFEAKSVEGTWVEVLSVDESLKGLLPKVTALRGRLVSNACPPVSIPNYSKRRND